MLSLGYLAASAAYLANASTFCKELESQDLDCNRLVVKNSWSEIRFGANGIGGFGVFAAVLTLICQIGTLLLLILRLKFLNTKIPGMQAHCSILLLIVSCVAMHYFATYIFIACFLLVLHS